MSKLLLWAAAVTFSFAAFLASCAGQQPLDAQAPAAATHKDANQCADQSGTVPDAEEHSRVYSGALLSR